MNRALARRPPLQSGQDLERYIRGNSARFVRELSHFIAFRSVSSDPSASFTMRACALWLVRHLQQLGAADARLLETAGHPIVVGRITAPSDFTLLIYGHYDVQPADAQRAWHSPPFRAQVRNGYIYGRGASDDKGQLFAHLKAVEALRQLRSVLPVNVLFLIEGEEEIGSPHFDQFLVDHKAELRCDAAIVSDTPVIAPTRPAITHTLRGDLYLDVEVSSPGPDLHSGTFGGAVTSASRALVAALGRLHDGEGKVRVPGFYDDVIRLPLRERERLRLTGLSDRQVERESGGAVLFGEREFSAYERTTIRPALEISGIEGGYVGNGVKGVIPARARAKLDIRLVPKQRPDVVHRQIFEFLRSQLPSGFELQTRERMRVAPVLLPTRGRVFEAALRAYARGFGAPASCLRQGGSIQAVAALRERLAVPIALMGFALPDDRPHAPNERFSLSMLATGIKTSAAFLDELPKP